MTDRTPGTMGPEWMADQIRRANPEEVVAKMRYHAQDFEYPPMEPMRRVYGHDISDATYIEPEEKPGMAATWRELARIFFGAVLVLAVMALPFVAGAIIWRMM